MLLAAMRQRVNPRHCVAAPGSVHGTPEWLTAHAGTSGTAAARRPAGPFAPGPLRLPATSVDDGHDTGVGVVDLGPDGLAVASTVNFALRTPAEQESLVATFGRYLHSLTAPVQGRTRRWLGLLRRRPGL